MKLSPETQRKLVWESLFKADGNREEAAKAMGVSARTFYRYIRDLDLYPELDKMGWTSQPGPPRGGAKGAVSTVRMRAIAHIKKNKGEIDYGALAIELYAKDGRSERQRVYSMLDDLIKQGRVAIRGERWMVLDEAVKA